MKGPQNPAQQDIPVLVCAEASPWNSVLEFGGKIQKGTDKRPTERCWPEGATQPPDHICPAETRQKRETVSTGTVSQFLLCSQLLKISVLTIANMDFIPRTWAT